MLERLRSFFVANRPNVEHVIEEPIEHDIGERIVKKALELLKEELVDGSSREGINSYYCVVGDAFGVSLSNPYIEPGVNKLRVLKVDKNAYSCFEAELDGHDRFTILEFDMGRRRPMTRKEAVSFMEEFLVLEINLAQNQLLREAIGYTLDKWENYESS